MNGEIVLSTEGLEGLAALYIVAPPPPPLLPCPFCGCGQVTEYIDNIRRLFYVSCKGCGASGPPSNRAMVALTLWNGRAKGSDGDTERGDAH